MIVVACANCSRRHLLPLGRVLGLSTYTTGGRVVHRLDYRCWCDYLGSEYIAGPAKDNGSL